MSGKVSPSKDGKPADPEIDLIVRALKQIAEEPERFSMIFIQQAAAEGARLLNRLQPREPVKPPTYEPPNQLSILSILGLPVERKKRG